MYSSDPQLLTWLLNRKAPTAKEESNHKEEEDGCQWFMYLQRQEGILGKPHVTCDLDRQT